MTPVRFDGRSGRTDLPHLARRAQIQHDIKRLLMASDELALRSRVVREMAESLTKRVEGLLTESLAICQGRL